MARSKADRPRMLPRAFVVVVLGLLALVCSGCDENAAKKEELRALFANIDNCYNTSDGVGVLDLYTQSTFTYYDTLMPIILDGTVSYTHLTLPTNREV